MPGYTPYTLTKEQIDALNALPPGVYLVCAVCERFSPMPDTIAFTQHGPACEPCALKV